MFGSETVGSAALGLLRLESLGDGRFSGTCIEGSTGRVFGGHVLAHTIRALSLAIDDRRPAHSLHATFIRPAVSTEPIDYATEVLKSGRSLDVVSVRAEQSGRVVFTAFGSAHEPEPSIEDGLPMLDVPDPDELESSDFSIPGTNLAVRTLFDRRYVPKPGRSRIENVWIRLREQITSTLPADHTALLAYAVDFLLTRAAHVALPELPLIGASLDHAMWFHRPFRIDQWLLVSSTMDAFSDSRSLCTCTVYDRDGRVVATAAQEALLRAEALPRI